MNARVAFGAGVDFECSVERIDVAFNRFHAQVECVSDAVVAIAFGEQHQHPKGFRRELWKCLLRQWGNPDVLFARGDFVDDTHELFGISDGMLADEYRA